MTDTTDSLARLLQYCEYSAKEMLRKSGSFAPFGAFINGAGKLEKLAVQARCSAEGFEIIGRLLEQLAKEEELQAYAVAADVRVPAEYKPAFEDGIRIQLESRGYSRFLYTPYRLLPHQWLRRFLAVVPAVEYGKEIAVDTKATFFRDERAA